MPSSTNSPCSWLKSMCGKGSGGRWRGLILIGLLVSGCSLPLRVLDSSVRTIRLREAPLKAPCFLGPNLVTCVVVFEQDWQTLIIDYKAKCIRLGGTPKNCQTEPEGTP